MIMHKSTSLADQVFDRLEQDILNGTYRRGSILTEVKLSEELGVSRTPIREALRRLEQEHIIEQQSKGLIVLGISAEDARYIYEIRTLLEGIAARACAENITDEQLKELTDITELHSFYSGKHDSEKVKSFDGKFHEAIYKYSGSTVLYDTLMPLHRKIQKYRKASVENGSRAEASSAEHRRIFAAIARRDAAAAEQAMLAHVCAARDYVINDLNAEAQDK